MELSGIKNIIFDLGGVIIPIDFQRTYKAFSGIALRNNISEIDFNQIDIFHDLEIGNITEAQFRNKVRTIIGEASDEEIDDAWLALLLKLPVDRLYLIRELKKNYRIFLLSNTSDIHLREIRRQNAEMNADIHFVNLFEKEYYSHEIGMRKPSVEIYQHVLDMSRLVASETVFIDDVLPNAKAAELVGIKGVHLDLGKQDVFGLFKSSLVCF
jgi:FMN phosphatase YigB (HAD superfamily)